jgi:hypothetical protein
MTESAHHQQETDLSSAELRARQSALERLKRLVVAHNRAVLLGVVLGLGAGFAAVVWAVSTVATSRWSALLLLVFAIFLLWRSVHLHRSMIADTGRARGVAATLVALLQTSRGTRALAAIEKRFSSGGDLLVALDLLGRLRLIHAYVENDTHMLAIHSERLGPIAPPHPVPSASPVSEKNDR